jgi:hypothetical protein
MPPKKRSKPDDFSAYISGLAAVLPEYAADSVRDVTEWLSVPTATIVSLCEQLNLPTGHHVDMCSNLASFYAQFGPDGHPVADELTVPEPTAGPSRVVSAAPPPLPPGTLVTTSPTVTFPGVHSLVPPGFSPVTSVTLMQPSAPTFAPVAQLPAAAVLPPAFYDYVKRAIHTEAAALALQLQQQQQFWGTQPYTGRHHLHPCQ